MKVSFTGPRPELPSYRNKFDNEFWSQGHIIIPDTTIRLEISSLKPITFYYQYFTEIILYNRNNLGHFYSPVALTPDRHKRNCMFRVLFYFFYL